MLDEVLAAVPAEQTRAYLLRVAEGEGARVCRELNRLRLVDNSEEQHRPISASVLVSKGDAIREVRIQKEKEEWERRRREKEAAKQRHLRAVFDDADSIWAHAGALVASGKVKAYDEAAAKLNRPIACCKNLIYRQILE